ncbi:MAG: sulfatase-like hydrolase/transferase, partial [Candidatus Lokiarchaeota archaeon]|nr:sulfatase-like hydrolase/transferase [Candidatus Lokiarchaeota archaeon]
MSKIENQKRKPNVILILTDDQGYGDLNFHGNEKLDTPYLNEMKTQAIEFTHFYVSPLCAPTRASVLTGRYHPRTGTLTTEQNLETFKADEVTIAQGLKKYGYKTGCFGKWHNGCFYPHNPKGKGFDEFLGFYGGFTQNYFDPVLFNIGDKQIKTEGFITDVLTEYAIKFIENNQCNPFFCFIPYNACHTPIQCPDRLFNKYKSRGLDDYNAGIYAMLENVDSNIQKIIDKIEDLKINEDTIVIFLSDNGANMLPPFFMRYNARLRGFKGTIHEGGNRVPMFIKWDNHLCKDIEIDKIAAHIDLFPTIFDLCGLDLPKTQELDGRSLVPLLKQKSDEWSDRTLYTHV